MLSKHFQKATGGGMGGGAGFWSVADGYVIPGDPFPNLEKLKAYNAYYKWRREQAGENSGEE
jgi:hypothetical protein